jgi:parvulin-like peptidyl-prolyl isomerase
MNGSDAQSRVTSAGPVRRRSTGWIWTVGALVAVVAIGAAIRLSDVPRAAAQTPGVRAGSPSAPTRLSASPATGRQTLPATAPGRSQGAAGSAAVQPATAGKIASPPPASTLQVMAVINGEQITRTELGRECIRRYGEEVLESMVNRQLISDACVKKGVQVTDADVSTEIDKVAGRFGLSRDRWLSLLRDERGFSEEQYRREVLWPMLALRHLVASEIEITDADLKKAYESEFGSKVRARLIAVDTPQKASQVRAQALADPNAFGELSKKHTAEPGVAAAYGVIPPIRRHLGDPGLEQVAFGLKPGQISEVVHVANMYYILKCEEILPQQYLSTQQMAEQQGRMKEKLKENKLRASAAEFFEKRKQEAQIELVLGDEKKQQQMPGVAAVVNGRQLSLTQLADECITRHGSDVLDGEVNRKVLQQELNRKRLVVSDQDIDAEVTRAAEAYGFAKADGTPDVEKWLKSVTEQPGATVDLYVRDAVWPSVALKKLVGSKVDVNDEDLRKGFESNYGERVELQAIVFSDMRQAQKVWDLARGNNTEAFFSELAKQYSIEPSSRSNGGKVPPIRRFGGSPVIEDEAFKLKAGELSGIVAVDGQFIVMRCQGRTRPVQTDFNAVQGELVKDIQEKKLRMLMTKEFDRLRQVSQVDNFLAGSSHSGARSVSPVGLLPSGPGNQQGMTGISPTARGTASALSGSAALPRTSGAQAR